MNEAKPPRKKPGPPPRYAPGKRPTLTFRVREDLHQQLKDTAAASGRSISEEVERRVEESLEEENANGTLRAMLHRAGWQKIAGVRPAPGTHTMTVYVDPESIRPVEFKDPESEAQRYSALDPALEEAIERAVIRALEKAKAK